MMGDLAHAVYPPRPCEAQEAGLLESGPLLYSFLSYKLLYGVYGLLNLKMPFTCHMPNPFQRYLNVASSSPSDRCTVSSSSLRHSSGCAPCLR